MACNYDTNNSIINERKNIFKTIYKSDNAYVKYINLVDLKLKRLHIFS